MISRMLLRGLQLAAGAVLLALVSLPVSAQTAPTELKVGTRVLPPMVVQQGDALSGFSIDLWNAIGERMKVKTTYQVAPDVRALLGLVREKQVDAAIAAISITAAREAEFDFSQPMMSAGLQIMVRGKGKDGDANPLADLAGLIFSKGFLVWLGVALMLVLIPAHIVWFLERNHSSALLAHKAYFPGYLTRCTGRPRRWRRKAATCRVTGCRASLLSCGCSPASSSSPSTLRNCRRR